ncbi:MAG TPA: hypothetical protein VFU19_19975 [Iamia sp.]|nr:hypothetical protein [Iamia sp.]
MTVVLHGVDEVLASTGTALGPTEWVEITAARLADWEAACPGAPVGWLLLSLTNLFMPEMIRVEDVSAGLNIGTGEVRFAPGSDTVVAGTRVRARGEVTSVTEPTPGSAQTTIRITVESDAPLLQVDAISRWLA